MNNTRRQRRRTDMRLPRELLHIPGSEGLWPCERFRPVGSRAGFCAGPKSCVSRQLLISASNQPAEIALMPTERRAEVYPRPPRPSAAETRLLALHSDTAKRLESCSSPASRSAARERIWKQPTLSWRRADVCWPARHRAGSEAAVIRLSGTGGCVQSAMAR